MTGSTSWNSHFLQTSGRLLLVTVWRNFPDNLNVTLTFYEILRKNKSVNWFAKTHHLPTSPCFLIHLAVWRWQWGPHRGDLRGQIYRISSSRGACPLSTQTWTACCPERPHWRSTASRRGRCGYCCWTLGKTSTQVGVHLLQDIRVPPDSTVPKGGAKPQGTTQQNGLRNVQDSFSLHGGVKV